MKKNNFLKLRNLLLLVIMIILAVVGCTQSSSGSGSSGGGSSHHKSSGGSSSNGGSGNNGGSSSTDYTAMVSIAGGTYTQTDGTFSFSHTISSFYIGKYEVTYALWNTVYQWATANGYSFANPGVCGSDGSGSTNQPVTKINWRDVIVWCNAYSQMKGLTPVYCTDGGYTTPLKASTNNGSINTTAGSEDNPYVNWSATGYRLPTEGEWQYAASDKGVTLYNYASGATADYNNATETQKVAWYSANCSSTHDVGTKNSNQLDIYDMSGNVWEWCWDWYGNYPNTAQSDYRGSSYDPGKPWRILRGASWPNIAYNLQIGYRYDHDPSNVYNDFGFRVARTN